MIFDVGVGVIDVCGLVEINCIGIRICDGFELLIVIFGK